jgi:hypothetical protein
MLVLIWQYSIVHAKSTTESDQKMFKLKSCIAQFTLHGNPFALNRS